MATEPLSVRLNTEKDKDIIDFLSDKPKGYIVRLALRRFMNDSGDALDETPTVKKKENNEGGSVLGW